MSRIEEIEREITETANESRTNPNFTLGYIYKLYHPRWPSIFYIGSSCDTELNRLRGHIDASFVNETLLYNTMSESGDIRGWVLERIESFPCINNSQLRQQEEAWRVSLEANLNVYRCWVSNADMIESNRIRSSLNYQENTERILARQADLRQEAITQAKYRCDDCEVCFGTASKLKRHLTSLKHTNLIDGIEPVLSASATRARENKASGRYKCNVCNTAFGSSSDLNDHLGSLKHKKALACYEDEECKES